MNALISDIADKYAAAMEPNDSEFVRAVIIRQALEELAAEMESGEQL